MNELYAGLELMVAGMGTVFVFLTLLVGCTALMSRLVMRLQPPAEPLALAARGAVSSGTDIDADTVAAITAAIRRHRAGQ